MQSMIMVTKGSLLLSSPEAITVVHDPTQPASNRSSSSGTLESMFAMQMFAAFVAAQVPAMDPIETPWGNSAFITVPDGVMKLSARCSPPRAHGMS